MYFIGGKSKTNTYIFKGTFFLSFFAHKDIEIWWMVVVWFVQGLQDELRVTP